MVVMGAGARWIGHHSTGMAAIPAMRSRVAWRDCPGTRRECGQPSGRVSLSQEYVQCQIGKKSAVKAPLGHPQDR